MRSRPIGPVRRQVRLSASAVAGLYLGWRMAKGLLAKSYLYEIQRRIVGIHLVLAFVILPPRWRWWDVEEEPIPNRAVSR